jgi:2-dehydro-3-deoxy-D-arabinonate dehydratase
MYLTRHQTSLGPRWAIDGAALPLDFQLGLPLQLPQKAIAGFLQSIPTTSPIEGPLLPPLESQHEVWASGVTYLRSREAREAESTVRDVYARVYDAPRPELFFKAPGWRCVADGDNIRVRADSKWNVPEPELTLVINAQGEIVGYTAGNDVSSRDIEGENPLYLPQAKVYTASCALGPGIVLSDVSGLRDLPIDIAIHRAGAVAFEGSTRISRMKRTLDELAEYLCRELDFPRGAFLMTGTGIVPPHEFSMSVGDVVRITIGSLTLENPVVG